METIAFLACKLIDNLLELAAKQPEENDSREVRPIRREEEEERDYLDYDSYPDDDSRK